MKVKKCFGNYGNQDLITKQGTLGCTMLCKDYKLCSKCYWGWYRKKHKIRLKEVINKFMGECNLEYENFRGNFKKHKIQRN